MTNTVVVSERFSETVSKGEVTDIPKNFLDFMNDEAFIIYTLPIVCRSYKDKKLEKSTDVQKETNLDAEALQFEVLDLPFHPPRERN